MEKIRQFVAEDQSKVVNCEWNPNHGAWVCQCATEERFNCCSTEMEGIYGELKEAGYQEHRH